jgi:TRAP-type C4-dicarboxylate transport system substrate-binding protein
MQWERMPCPCRSRSFTAHSKPRPSTARRTRSPRIETSKFFEVQKYVSLTQHVYNPLVTIFSKKTWDKLTPAEQKIIQDAANEAGAYERKVSREANDKAVEVLKKNGMAINAIAPAEIARMREKTKPVLDKFVKEYGEATANEIFAEIAKVRGK